MSAQPSDACVENGQWTAVPRDPPAPSDFTLHFSDVDAPENQRIEASGVMSFHMVGCTGDFSNHTYQQHVANAMAAQVNSPGSPGTPHSQATNASFFFHLGDVVYKPDNGNTVSKDQEAVNQKQMYNAQFYDPYRAYDRSIFAIAGNHDGKNSTSKKNSAIHHFLRNFCASQRKRSKDNETDNRPAMNQPYVYWRLETPLAYIIGLYSNIANGGILDDPTKHSKAPQYQWLVRQLEQVKKENKSHMPRKAVLLAVHYPPYSGATNFIQRGDPTLGPTPGVEHARPFGDLLQEAFTESGQYPDAVFSAHAHLYQRLTYRYKDGREVPYLIAGSGGHSPVEQMWEQCDRKKQSSSKAVPFDAELPPGMSLPAGDSVQVAACDDQSFGFLRLTIASGKLTGEFFTASPQPLALGDAFILDMDSHSVTGPA